MNRLVFIRKILYRLKRRYGSQVDILYRKSSVTDRATGEKVVSKGGVRVKRMICLPSQVHKEFAYDLTFIANNKNFTYGGLYDTNQRRFIVDVRDLPRDFEITTDMWLIYDGVRYDVKQTQRFEENYGVSVLAEQVETVTPEELHVVELEDTLGLEDDYESQLA